LKNNQSRKDWRHGSSGREGGREREGEREKEGKRREREGGERERVTRYSLLIPWRSLQFEDHLVPTE
jgi:hypothetical protein